MNIVSKLFSGFFRLFYPKVCAVCGADLVEGEEVFCISCLYNIPLTRFWNDKENTVAKIFWGRVNIEDACAYFFFAKGSKYRPLLHKLKYQGFKEIGFELGLQFGNVLKKSPLYSDIDFVVPVPLHPKKLRIRGYNQAEVIADGISKGLGTELSTTHLERTEFTETQTRKTRAERVKNVTEAFAVAKSDEIKGKHLLLVDDVVTTGATLEACAAKLLEIEGCRVSIAALAYATT
ncbi:MAG TPA: phosphoribosyltransferase family protein [Tenuifilaceae bacterium]|nr:phosphoribosyltransferase family protein [Tenuifilaceae bacterium]